jgi:tRNA threonylcarbamoyladenosine biosynthesis protein TsaB
LDHKLLILAIHSSSPVLGAALLDDSKVLSEITLAPGKRHQENLAPTILEVLEKAGKTADQLGAIAAAKGPGSFSGIRVGLAMAKGMAMGLNKPLVGVSSLECLAWQGLESGQTGISFIDARRDEVYYAVYTRTDIGIGEIMAPDIVSRKNVPELVASLPQISAALGDTIIEDLHSANLLPVSIKAHTLTPSPRACGKAALVKWNTDPIDELHTLTPLYIRKSDAEVNAKRV